MWSLLRLLHKVENKMTNVSATPEKVELRRRLFGLGEKALEQDGWRLERIPGSGKASVRRIIRNGESRVVSIRTTQDTWIAFPRSADGGGWVTLDDVDTVIAVTVDDREAPKWAAAYMVSAEEMRQRFDRAYQARKDAGHSVPAGRGVWVSMFAKEDQDVVATIGGGIAVGKEPMLRVRLSEDDDQPVALTAEATEAPLTIAEAKNRLALSFGVDPEKVKITIEG